MRLAPLHSVPLALALCLLLAAEQARAGAKEECVRAADQGQDLLDRGQLQGALRAFYLCASDRCPRLVQRECGKWVTQAVARQPTVVPFARDAQGRDLIDVTLQVDGVELLQRLDGRAIPLDPGPHQLRLAQTGGAALELRVLVREGEKDRPVGGTLAVPAAVASPPPTLTAQPSTVLAAPPPRVAPHPAAMTPMRWGAVALTATAGVGAATFAGLAVAAKADVDHMRSTCAPSCSAGQVALAQHKEIIADVSLGVGVLAAAGALYLWLRPQAPRPAVSVSVAPSSAGGSLAVSGQF